MFFDSDHDVFLGFLTAHLAPETWTFLCAQAGGRPLTPPGAEDSGASSTVGSGNNIAILSGRTRVPASASFTLALLRRLRQLGSPFVEQELSMQLQNAAAVAGHQDTDLQTACAMVEEELARKWLLENFDLPQHYKASEEEAADADGSSTKKDRRFSSKFAEPKRRKNETMKLVVPALADAYTEAKKMSGATANDPTSMLKKVRAVAYFRAYTKEYVWALREQFQALEGEEQSTTSPKLVPQISSLPSDLHDLCALCAEELLDTSSDNSALFPVRSARMLQLKTWERLGGSSELQRALTVRPVKGDTLWFEQWCMDPTASELKGFLSGSRLPSWNPFADVATYEEAHAKVHSFNASQSAAELEK